ncbi:MAG: hypothetical protein MJZ66_08110 [Bacteroidales bacterium]|nr:hypothetical protein [Bacteroidales bacterium]
MPSSMERGDISQILSDVRRYIDDNLESEAPVSKCFTILPKMAALFGGAALHKSMEPEACATYSKNFTDILDRLEDSFSTLLLKYIRQKGMSNAEVYKEANLDRRLFSKIISNNDYAPAKSTVLALVVALRLNIDEAATLLKSAGYAISHSSRVDLVVEYFILKGGKDYNIFQINDVLESLGLQQFGSKSWQS